MGLKAVPVAAGKYLWRDFNFSSQNWLFLRLQGILKEVKIKRKFSYNLGENFLRLFHFLAQVFFTTNETKLDYYHQKVSAWVASGAAKQLKT